MSGKDLICRTRSISSNVERINRTALKFGAISIANRTVGANEVEVTVTFRKARDKTKFDTWIGKTN